jgi:hypothetical protein
LEGLVVVAGVHGYIAVLFVERAQLLHGFRLSDLLAVPVFEDLAVERIAIVSIGRRHRGASQDCERLGTLQLNIWFQFGLRNRGF